MANKPASTIVSGTLEVTTAGTRQQLVKTGQSFIAQWIIIQALSTNEEAVVVGGPDVVAAAGAHGSSTRKGFYFEKPGTASTFNAPMLLEIADPSAIWVDSLKAKDGVSWIAGLA